MVTIDWLTERVPGSDQPAGSLTLTFDTRQKNRFRATLDERGLTVLLVEQKLPFARRVADTFCLLDRGRNVAAGPMPALDEELVTKYLTV